MFFFTKVYRDAFAFHLHIQFHEGVSRFVWTSPRHSIPWRGIEIRFSWRGIEIRLSLTYESYLFPCRSLINLIVFFLHTKKKTSEKSTKFEEVSRFFWALPRHSISWRGIKIGFLHERLSRFVWTSPMIHSIEICL